MTPATWALLGATLPVLAAAVLAVKAWLRGRETARVRGQLERVELERDAAGGRALTAEATAAAHIEHTERQQAAAEVAEELDHAVASAGDDHLDRRAAALEWMRAQGDGARPGASGGDAAAVRDDGAAGSTRGGRAR